MNKLVSLVRNFLDHPDLLEIKVILLLEGGILVWYVFIHSQAKV